MTIDEYIDKVPEERKKAFIKLLASIRKNIPKGFQEAMNYGMIGFVVPHSLYPAGYHCNPKDPLPFIGLASQKHSINFYHLGLYQSQELMQWFVGEYQKVARHKIAMGKSCVRFKYVDEIPYGAIEKLVKKISVMQWIKLYEGTIKK